MVAWIWLAFLLACQTVKSFSMSNCQILSKKRSLNSQVNKKNVDAEC